MDTETLVADAMAKLGRAERLAAEEPTGWLAWFRIDPDDIRFQVAESHLQWRFGQEEAS